VEPGESWENAAVREVQEETGYLIEIGRFVGEYWRHEMPDGGDLKYVYTGHIIGGTAIERGAETRQVKWFSLAQLPFSLSGFMREYIQDAQNGIGVRKVQQIPKWKAVLIKYLLKARDMGNEITR
jgi:ADP-ribose pyrophosphatase YjhB (NUDIX family)